MSSALDLLSAEQRRVAELPVDATALVTAGPGAGKTHTLVHRILHLLDQGIEGYEILVLTFSRAAVATLRTRLRSVGADASRVRARTFDSWALELLREAGHEQTPFDGNFDRRILSATALLKDENEEVLDDLRHVVVDEVQDLVGVRRELVRTLLVQFECGFTLVGDPAQSIYGFQRKSEEKGSFTADLYTDFSSSLVRLELTESFRFRTEDARRAVPLGPGLRSGRPGPDPLRELRDTLESLDLLGSLDTDYSLGELASYDGTTALLCRTNGEALALSEMLWAGGLEHRLRRAATDRAAPGWLTDVFGRTAGGVLTRERFSAIAQDLELEASDALWSSLLRAGEDRSGRLVDLGRLRDAIADGRLPDELVAEADPRVLVSSVHRAKGLEFDRVVVVDPGPAQWKRITGDTQEEARLLFVAMTRARRHLWSATPLHSWLVRRADELGRWARFGVKQWQRCGLEFGGGDVRPEQPGPSADRAQRERAQDEAVMRLRRGDPVEFRRLDTIVPAGEAPEYLLLHDGVVVGAASSRMREGLRRFMHLGPKWETRNWPGRIHGLRVDGTETVVGEPGTAREAGLNEFGVRRVPRLVGLSRFEYRKDAADG